MTRTTALLWLLGGALLWACGGDSGGGGEGQCSNANFLTEETCVAAGHTWSNDGGTGDAGGDNPGDAVG
ncbi:MAG: hypothetical protein QF464_14485, partial [Myxococcota bacterium]|nr:hypothetical protein [Myxococcota bacterium]